MRLPIIKHALSFIERNDQDWVVETVELLEDLSEAPGIKDEELEVIGEIISNLYGALEVAKDVNNGVEKKVALNKFMQRVVGSIS